MILRFFEEIDIPSDVRLIIAQQIIYIVITHIRIE